MRNPPPSSGSRAVRKNIGTVGSKPRIMSRNMKPSISPIIMSVMTALNESGFLLNSATADSTPSTAMV